MDASHSTTVAVTTKRRFWNRREVADRWAQARQLDQPGYSQSRIARQIGVPRTTLQHWRKRRQRLENAAELSPAVSEFFRVAPGLGIPPPAIGRHPSGLRPSA